MQYHENEEQRVHAVRVPEPVVDFGAEHFQGENVHNSAKKGQNNAGKAGHRLPAPIMEFRQFVCPTNVNHDFFYRN